MGPDLARHIGASIIGLVIMAVAAWTAVIAIVWAIVALAL